MSTFRHRAQVQQAVQKYRTNNQQGGKDKTSWDESMETLGGLLGGSGISPASARAAQKALAEKSAPGPQEPQDDKYGFHQDWASGNNKYGMNMTGMRDSAVAGPEDTMIQKNQNQEAADKALMMMKFNDMADKTRLGGVYSPNGMQLTQRDAQLNAEDRLRAKSMIGLAGSQTLGLGY